MFGNPHGALSEDFTQHVDRALEFFKQQGQPVNRIYTTLLGVAEHGPQVVVTHGMYLGDGLQPSGAEQDHVVVVGLYVPSFGNVTTVINHIDGCVTIDNADELFLAETKE